MAPVRELLYSFELSRKLNALRMEKNLCDVTLVVNEGNFELTNTNISYSVLGLLKIKLMF